ncbi:MAG: hypothetical protein JWM45_97 [Pseudonocardiales bacterium]|nr:hypothetical protein [Pseudonocardiales bacterium]
MLPSLPERTPADVLSVMHGTCRLRNYFSALRIALAGSLACIIMTL